MRYYFGIYHWRRRFRRLLIGAIGICAGLVGLTRARRAHRRLVAAAVVGLGVMRIRRPVRSILSPPPWRVRTEKYARLARELAVTADETVLDVGCGTGRSLVGLADGLPAGTGVVGLDVFDSRVILGNGPRLATRNARRAGLDVAIVAGDAARLPLAANSVDVVTACRVLHDLPREDAEAALAECHRVLAPAGRLGVLELPITHEAGADPRTYWESRLAAAGFDVETATRAGREADYFLFVATPA